MASFCVALRMTPEEYRKLTLLELHELGRAYSKSQGSDLKDF